MSQDLLTLVQWLSPAFPTGGFAYSHGMEAAIDAGEIRQPEDLRTWLSDILDFGAGRQDAILLAQALKPGADHAALDALTRALQISSERLSETLDQGTAFARTVTAVTGRALPARCLPVAVGEAVSALTLEPVQVVELYLHAFVANLVSVAMRFMPLGQEAGQTVLSQLHPQVVKVARDATMAELDDLGSAALGADMSALAHETMDVRIFRT
ncbi:urease accessory protein UreF [Thioclava sp. FR2]|uniref:urease accessory protein UreF n=1 Tax=Thioclava sp. FR2 TaxID=3445780 RepID=UPI003EBDA4BF